jgi:hypothetical protein
MRDTHGDLRALSGGNLCLPDMRIYQHTRQAGCVFPVCLSRSWQFADATTFAPMTVETRAAPPLLLGACLDR